ncbi:MAG: DUF1538 family protein, partial [Clostridia bacterium]|nr:DUF1538 family protein [Clostridia bacterium]
LGTQIEELTNGHIKKTTIRITLALGIGVASLLSILKILTEINILYFLVPLYAISLVMMIFTPKLFVGLAFDSGGVTGGALTSAFLTPLTLSIAQAVAMEKGGTMSILTNGFGIISFISVTPLIAIQALGIIYNVRLKRATMEAQEESFEDLESFVMDLSTESQEDTGAVAEEDVTALDECAMGTEDTEVETSEEAVEEVVTINEEIDIANVEEQEETEEEISEEIETTSEENTTESEGALDD